MYTIHFHSGSLNVPKKILNFLPPTPWGGPFLADIFCLSIFSTLEVWKAPFFAGYDPKMISPPQFRFLSFTKSCRIGKSSFPVAVADRTNLVLRVQILHFWRFWPCLSPFFSPWDQKWNIFPKYRFLLTVRCQKRAKNLFSVDQKPFFGWPKIFFSQIF